MRKIINKTKNKNFLKKIFIKLCRKIGYEIIDQTNLYIPTLEKSVDENLSELGESVISIPLGKAKIVRKIRALTIIIRSYTSTHNQGSKMMLDQNKSRIFGQEKIEYTLRTINSIIISSHYALSIFNSLKINLIVTDDNSNDENLTKIKNVLNKANFDTSIINIQKDEFINEIKPKDENGNLISPNMISNMRNIYKSLMIAKDNADDLVYFLEDDYINHKDSITEMLLSYEKFTSQLNKEIFLCPADYPYLYTNIQDTKILIGHKRHWRIVNETLITFLTSKQMILKYWNELKDMATIRHHPMEKKLHQIYEKEYCFSPIPSLAMHSTNINSVYGIPPNINWKKLWDENKV